jgi:branched-chain amino acid transport system ATP-binding protein
VRDVEAGYGAVRALHGVSVEIRDGETVVLLGTNGNGKSTLMKCIMGSVRPTRGSVLLEIDGRTLDLARLSTEEIVNAGVAMVPEGRRLFPKLTVEENLLLGAFRPAARDRIPENLKFCYTTFPVLKERARQLAGSLSGGQQQMLAIARALMSSPRLLLVDEPSVGIVAAAGGADDRHDPRAETRLRPDGADGGAELPPGDPHRGSRLHYRARRDRVRGGTVAELEQNPLVKHYYLGTS